jgi:hypothetical protein
MILDFPPPSFPASQESGAPSLTVVSFYRTLYRKSDRPVCLLFSRTQPVKIGERRLQTRPLSSQQHPDPVRSSKPVGSIIRQACVRFHRSRAKLLHPK